MIRQQIFFAVVVLFVIPGCSSGQSPVAPDANPNQAPQISNSSTNRTTLGFWTVRIDPDSETFEIVSNREITSHFNVVKLLEVAPCSSCLTIENLEFLSGNKLQCNMRLQHPFPGAVKFTGFDVRGIFITNGDTEFPESDLLVSLDGTSPVLLEPDGYTRNFNPTDFPSGSSDWPILEYIDGKFSNGNGFTSTLNPFVAYKKNKPRRMFESGSTESRTIQIKYPSVPFEFGYAIDASWEKTDDVVDPITDFPPEANCLEPYKMDFQMLDELTSETGISVGVQVEVFDHQGIDTISTISLECPTLFDGEVKLDYYSQSGDNSWLYEGEITNEYGFNNAAYPLLIKVVSIESDPNLGELAAYQIANVIIQCAVVGGEHLIWATQAGGLYTDFGEGITTLSDDSTVATGLFENKATFGEGEPNETVLVASGLFDFFIVRYNPDGTLAWAKRAGGTSTVWGQGITTLSDDSTVVTGGFYGTATFGEGEPNESILVADGGLNDDIFVAQYNPDGTLAWATQASGLSEDSAYGITTLTDDSTVVTGFFRGSTVFGMGEPNETVLVNNSEYADVFIARYNPDGTLAWAKQAGGDEVQVGYGITPISDDSTIVTGIIVDSATFGEGEANETVLVSNGSRDIFIARYNPDGTLVWAKRAGGSSSDLSFGVTTHSDDTIVLTGRFSGTTIFGEGDANETVLESAGNHDIFIAKYNSDGTLVWANRSGGTGWDEGLGITTLSDDSTAVTGYFSGSATFGESEPNEIVLESDGSEDIFVARYNPDGTLAWVQRAGGMDWDHGEGITTLSDDSTVVVGNFKGTSTIGECEPNETLLESYGESDIFVARYAP